MSNVEMNKCYFVVVGAGGWMGQNGINALPLINKNTLATMHLFIVETKVNLWASIESSCVEKLGLIPASTDKLRDVLTIISKFDAFLGKEHPVIIYDATPTSVHAANLLTVYEQEKVNTFYICEKPIFIDKIELENTRKQFNPQFNFFCDLIETENPVFKSVYKHIKDNNYKIKHMQFWRAGSTGIKKAVCADRDGIEGGALEDKSLHDLSMTVGFLGVENIKNFTVQEANVHHLIVSKEFYFANQTQSLLGVRNTCVKEIDINFSNKNGFPADGLFSAKVLWNMNSDEVIPVDYVFSWVGYTRSQEELKFVEKLQELGFDEKQWLSLSKIEEAPTGEEVKDSLCKNTDKKFSVMVEEVRIGIIECENKLGEKITFVCNFLKNKESKGDVESSNKFNRYAWLISNQGREKIYEDHEGAGTYADRKKGDLSSIFLTVLNHIFNDKKAVFIDRTPTLLIHDVMFQMQEVAFSRIVGTDIREWFKNALPEFEKRITPH